MLPNEIDPELTLMGTGSNDDGLDITGGGNHALQTAPMIMGDVVDVMGSMNFPQRALYGRILETSTGVQVKYPKLYINTNAPFSGIVCGVQGSGKSHSTSVLLEGCLIRDRRLGTLPEPLSALLFHFDTAAGAGEVSPCEAAFIASLEATLGGDAAPPRVVVLVLPNNFDIMRRVYSRLPEVEVKPLHFSPEDLNGDRLLSMMKVEQDQHMPLYMECIMSILRSMSTFSYDEFRRQLREQKFSPAQKMMLDLRLSILDSCLEGGSASNRVSKHFRKGQLTIIDLSSPFMDASSACGFFDIILGLFIQDKTAGSGKLVVLDEAHKYLTNSASSSRLTDSLLSVIRQQRHLGTRVLISTQEPTVVPSNFIDLCSFVIAHRFSSQKWLDYLKAHISAEDTQWKSKVVNLKPGEAMIFSAAALVLRQGSYGHIASPENGHLDGVAPLGQGYMIVRSRNRITVDGGRSVLAVESPLYTQSMLMSNNGSISPSQNSVADALQIPSISWKIHQETSRERAYAFNLPDPVSASSVCSRSTSPSRNPGFKAGTTAGATPVSPANRTIIMQSPRSVEVEQWITTGSSNSPAPVPNNGYKSAASAQTLTSSPEARFRPLISILNECAKRGEYRIQFSNLGSELKKLEPVPYVKLGEYLKEAEQTDIVEIGGSGATSWVQLSTRPRPQLYPHEYVSLAQVMQSFLAKGVERPKRSDVAVELRKRDRHAVPGRFKTYISGAEAKGVVVTRKNDTLQLVT